MTSTDRLLAGVIAALFVPAERENDIKAALGVVIVCVALATTIDVMTTTTVAIRITPGRENFWIRIVIAFILFGFLLCSFFLLIPVRPRAIAPGGVSSEDPAPRMSSVQLKIR